VFYPLAHKVAGECPQKIFYENGVSILQYSKLLKKEFLFRNDNLITIREIESKKHALKNS
jgi:hypothetical protein